jgi:hypothetical protein
MKRFASFFLIAAVALGTLGLTACKDQGPAPLSVDQQREINLANAEKNRKLQDLLEQQRSTALANASRNASSYFAANPRFDSAWKIIPHTDDQIDAACPQGSGWAWVSIMKVTGKEVEKNRIWCSTSSSSLGCYIEADFAKLPYSGQAATCDGNLPHPLKPISK